MFLRRRQIQRHYGQALQVWRDTRTQTVAECRSMVEHDPARYGIDPMMVLTIIQILVSLWQIWEKHRVTDPPVTFSQMEFDSAMMQGVTFDDSEE